MHPEALAPALTHSHLVQPRTPDHDAQVGESQSHQLYASGAGHLGGTLPGPADGFGAGATVQVLRSVDGRSALLDRGNPFPVLHYKKGRPVDASILNGCALLAACSFASTLAACSRPCAVRSGGPSTRAS
jgi:hypothetical protein